MQDDVRLAYATLGLPQGASLREVKARRRALVRRWHPDRFQNDPQGQAEATQRLRAINDAYQVVVDSLPKVAPSTPRPATVTPGPRFTTTPPATRAETVSEETRFDRALRFCLGAIVGGLAGRLLATLLPPNDLLALGLLVIPAVAVGIGSALYGHRFLDWLAEPRP